MLMFAISHFCCWNTLQEPESAQIKASEGGEARTLEDGASKVDEDGGVKMEEGEAQPAPSPRMVAGEEDLPTLAQLASMTSAEFLDTYRISNGEQTCGVVRSSMMHASQCTLAPRDPVIALGYQRSIGQTDLPSACMSRSLLICT